MRLGLLLLVSGCGFGLSASSPDAQPVADAGTSPDALPMGCSVAFSVTPTAPLAPIMLTATAAVAGGSGLIVIDWNITAPNGAALPVRELDTSGLRVAFTAAGAGPYAVGATVHRGTSSCLSTPTRVNVGNANAATMTVRLRYLPEPEHGAPPQDDPVLVTVPGGADYSLPAARTLTTGRLVTGIVMGPSGGLPAYLRLRSAGLEPSEFFADGLGRFQTRVHRGYLYDVLIVPYRTDVAPRLFLGATDGSFADGFVLDAGESVRGVVRAADGAPIAGARVAAAAGELPPLVVTTDQDGVFATRMHRREGPLALTVVPPATALYFSLAGGTDIRPADDVPFEVRLPKIETIEFTGRAVDSHGAPLAGASVTLLLDTRLPSGALTGAGEPALMKTSGRITLIADSAGFLPKVALARARWRVVVEPRGTAGQTLGVATLDLADGQTHADFAAAASVRGQVIVTDAAGARVAGARVTAWTDGLFGVGSGAGVTGTTDGQGAVDLPLAAVLGYRLTVDAPAARRLARGRAVLAVGQFMGQVQLKAAIAVRGMLVFDSGGGQAGIGVQALCDGCGDTEPLAETVTTAGGGFVLLLPDPGFKL